MAKVFLIANDGIVSRALRMSFEFWDYALIISVFANKALLIYLKATIHIVADAHAVVWRFR
jgi:hypothetical protein